MKGFTAVNNYKMLKIISSLISHSHPENLSPIVGVALSIRSADGNLIDGSIVR